MVEAVKDAGFGAGVVVFLVLDNFDCAFCWASKVADLSVRFDMTASELGGAGLSPSP